MKKLLHRFFAWIFSEEIKKMEQATVSASNAKLRMEAYEQRMRDVLGCIDLTFDVDQYSGSWAVISIQGQKQDFIRFIDMKGQELRYVQDFLRKFDRTKVDASPQHIHFFR